jgi:hypothetical protein
MLAEPRKALVLPLLKRAVDWWPYAFIVVSVTGLAYEAFKSLR